MIEKVAFPKLWTRNFALLCAANLLLTGAFYMLLPIFPYGAATWGISSDEGWVLSAVSGLAFGCMGPLCSFLLDRFDRRKVCLYSVGVMLLCMLLLAGELSLSFAGLLVVRIVQGAAYGMAQMALGSGLVIDLTVSDRRTDGNYCYNSIGRLALPLGPFAGLAVGSLLGWESALWVACGGIGLAIFLLCLLNVPFRAPLGSPLFSSDRFWLKGGSTLFCLLGLSCALLGGCLPRFSLLAYVSLLIGTFGAFFLLRFLHQVITLRVGILSGLFLLVVVGVMEWIGTTCFLLPLLAGMGITLVAKGGMLSLLRRAAHCERGCANSTYMLAVEAGLGLGMLLFFLINLRI